MKIECVNISKVYGDISIERGRNKRFYKYTEQREQNLLKFLRFVGNFAASQVYSPK